MLVRIFQQLQNLVYELKARTSTLPPRVLYDTPYICQFATPENAEKSLSGELNPQEDRSWAESGASSPKRYAQWAFTMCGMASLAMALGYFKDTETKPAQLAEDALAHGVYVEERDDISSMRYREFADWVGKYGLHARVYSRLSLRGIQFALAQHSLVIVSVNPNIRGYETAPKSQKGGHLVLVTGYDLSCDTVFINNPSGFLSTNTQINHQLPIPEFKKNYAGRGIVLSDA